MRARLLVLVMLVGCSRATTPPVNVWQDPAIAAKPIRTVAVAPAFPAGRDLADGATKAVTDLVLDAIRRAGVWRVLEPGDARSAEAENQAGLAAAAGKLAVAAKADATLVAEVARFHERVGGDLGVSEPASVALRLLLVFAGATKPVWRADYAHTQEPLTYNLWNFWQVQRGGVKWLTASEVAKIGIDEALARLTGQLVPER